MTLLAHLWQSTLFAGVAAALAFACRSTPARVRHAIWLAASVKFLIPLSLFVAAGASLGAAGAPPGPFATDWLGRSQWILSLDIDASRPYASHTAELIGRALGVIWILGVGTFAAMRCREWWTLSGLIRSAAPLRTGREREALARMCRAANSRRIRLVQSTATLEPGLIGVFRPTLLWPAELSERLTDEELDAILLHEVCHANRRDNLSALIHILVETLFWFHPAVWWVGNRMIRERERACDEAVLELGANERAYAEGILKVCGACLRAPAGLMAGVSGPTLTSRIQSILDRRAPSQGGRAARFALAAIVALAMGVPMAAGAGAAHRAQEPQTVYSPGKEVSQPRLIKEVKPKYTKEAMDARIEGTVWLEAVVLDTGDVGDVTVVTSLDKEYGLDDAAVAALKQWRFEPGRKDDKPVAVRIEVEMSFKLK